MIIIRRLHIRRVERGGSKNNIECQRQVPKGRSSNNNKMTDKRRSDNGIRSSKNRRRRNNKKWSDNKRSNSNMSFDDVADFVSWGDSMASTFAAIYRFPTSLYTL